MKWPVFPWPGLILAGAVLFLPSRTLAWDAAAHQVIATIAYDKLNPKAQKAVTDLARELQSSGQPYNAVTLSNWMDDLRKNDLTMPDHGKFLSWHYIDIGLESGDPAPSWEPGNDNEVHGNVVQALKRAMVVLKGGTDPYIQTRAEACAMVMHLVGDIHQPLHTATKYFVSGGQLRQDNGGNKEDVLNGPPEDAGRFNLHAFWDSAWRASFDEASGDVMLDARYHDAESVRAFAQSLAQKYPPSNENLDTQINPWAKESHQIAQDFAYREITATENKKYCRLSSLYVLRARELARARGVGSKSATDSTVLLSGGASRPVLLKAFASPRSRLVWMENRDY